MARTPLPALFIVERASSAVVSRRLNKSIAASTLSRRASASALHVPESPIAFSLSLLLGTCPPRADPGSATLLVQYPASRLEAHHATSPSSRARQSDVLYQGPCMGLRGKANSTGLTYTRIRGQRGPGGHRISPSAPIDVMRDDRRDTFHPKVRRPKLRANPLRTDAPATLNAALEEGHFLVFCGRTMLRTS